MSPTHTYPLLHSFPHQSCFSAMCKQKLGCLRLGGVIQWLQCHWGQTQNPAESLNGSHILVTHQVIRISSLKFEKSYARFKMENVQASESMCLPYGCLPVWGHVSEFLTTIVKVAQTQKAQIHCLRKRTDRTLTASEYSKWLPGSGMNG